MDSQTPTTFGGIDWATDDHAICIVDHAGDIVEELVVPHTSAGLRRLCAVLQNHGVARVAIERPDGPVVDALMSESIDVVVVPSRSVKAFRERYALSGTKSDRGDAYVLADCLRSDGHRWSSLQPDTPATVTLRQHVRARRDLVDTRVAVANQLRAHLAINFPGVVGLFSDIDGQTSRRFLRRFPTTDRSDWLTEKRLAHWLRSAGYNSRRSPADLYAHLAAAAPGTRGPDGEERAAVTLAYLDVIESIVEQIKALEKRMTELLDHHPDAHIFQSLPRCGTIRAATMLAEIGDCRRQVPRRRLPRMPRRRRTRHPSLRTAPSRGLPWDQQHEAPQRPLLLRWGLPQRQRVGRPPLPAASHRRQTTPPRRTDSRPHLDPDHLALLARQPALRPHPTRRPTPPPKRPHLT